MRICTERVEEMEVKGSSDEKGMEEGKKDILAGFQSNGRVSNNNPEIFSS
jgi:hypothetical protein